MSLKKLHFCFYTSNSPAVTWTGTCGCRKQAVARGAQLLETSKNGRGFAACFAYAKTQKTRLVSLSEGRHRGSARCRAAAPGGSHAAPCSSLPAGRGSGKPQSGLFSWLVLAALPLSSSTFLQQDPCAAELGPSFPELSPPSCRAPSWLRHALRAAPAPCPPLARVTQTPRRVRVSSTGVYCHHGGGERGQAPSCQPLSAPLSAVLRHLAGANPTFVAGCLGGTLVGAKPSEADKKQLGAYFPQNICCICKSVKTNAKTNLRQVYSLVLCFQPFSSSSSSSEEGMLSAQAFVPSDTAFGQWSKTI